MAEFKRDYSALDNLSKVITEIMVTAQSGVNVGWIQGTDADTLMKVWKMELAHEERGAAYQGWAVARRTKLKLRGMLSQMFLSAWRKGLRGEALWNDIGKEARDTMMETLLGTSNPSLTQRTLEMKREKYLLNRSKYARGIGTYGEDQIFVETGKSLDAINFEIVSKIEAKSSI